MFKRILLTKAEKRVIKKITRVQIKNLEQILNKDCELDITLAILQEGLSEKEFMEQTKLCLDNYREIMERPLEIFNLPEEDLSIAKHIMFNFATHPKYELGKKRIWRKLMLMETFPICLQ